jgi:hypothetical protein
VKKLLVTVLAMAALIALAYAPVQAATKLQAGLKAGLGLADIWGSDADSVFEGASPGTKVGFCGGGFLAIDAIEKVRIQPEILYVMKGAKATISGVDVKTKLDYLEIPVLVKWMIPTQSKISPNLFAGPAIAIRTSAKAEGEQGGVAVEFDIKDSVKAIDFGVVLGGGVDVKAGKGNATFDVRYTLGLSSFDDSSEKLDIKNGVISAMVGYSFPFGSK